MYRRIFLTGGTGFVGRRLAPRLAAAWPEARRFMLAGAGAAIPRGWTAMDATLETPALADWLASAKPDLIVHLAAQSSVAERDDARTWRVNFEGTRRLAAAMAGYRGATFLFASSAEVYGAAFNRGLVDETTAPEPGNVYARTKLAAEWLLRDTLAGHRGLLARPFNHSGPGQDVRFALSSFAAQIARIEAGLAPPAIRVGNLDAQRDFLHVDDVCDAYLALLNAPEADGVYNIASGRPRRIGDLLGALLARSDASIPIETDPDRLRPSDVPAAAGSSEKLRAATGWAPRRSIETLLDDLLGDWREKVRS